MSDQIPNAPPVDDTAQRIIAAALKLFTQGGYRRTTTRAIAAEAGVNEVTVFRHFGSKKNLFMACAAVFNAEGFTGAFEHHLTGDYRADILTMARLLQQDMSQGFEVMRLVLCDATEVPEVREVMVSGGRGNQARLAEYFREQIAAGVVRADLDPDVLAHALDSLFTTGTFYQKVFGDSFTGEVPEAIVVQQLADIFVQGTTYPEQE